MRHKYVCPHCGNEIEAVKVEKRHAGSKGMVRDIPQGLYCDRDNYVMQRVEYTPPRREVRRD